MIDQFLALLAFFIFPIIQYVWLKYRSKNEGKIKLWYLPAYGFRLVIRNLPRRHTLSDIKYRVQLRKIVPPAAGATVATLIDTPVHEKEDFFLFPGNDQTLLSFRIKGETQDKLIFTITDKLGNEQKTIPLAEFDRIICDYSATLNNLFNFNVHLAKRGEISSATLKILWQKTQSAPQDEDEFAIDRVRNVG
ncbi:MAG TPA: hypothetical protein VFR24_17140 [Candidatus Angelobacter sp.]|nr:hypothetical protein [Candidatus Angelobacter sp.]